MTQSIGEIAESLTISVDAVRYYERIGLVQPPHRDSAGRRRYTDDDAGWLQFLVRMRATGMPIRLLQTYATARTLGDSSIGRRRQILVQHRAEVAARIAELTESLAVIDYKIDNYTRIEADLAATTPKEISA